MGYIPVPKDLKQAEHKVFMGLSKRKLIGFAFAIPLGFVGYVLGSFIAKDVGMILLMILAAPPIMISMFSRDGIPATELAIDYLEAKQIRPPVRKFKETERNKKLNRVFSKGKPRRKKTKNKNGGGLGDPNKTKKQ